MSFLQSIPGSDPLELEAMYPVTAERLYRAWTDPEELVQWFGRKAGSLDIAEIDLRLGGDWRFTFREDAGSRTGFQGTYLAIEPARLLRFSWQFFRIAGEVKTTESDVSEVRVSFAPQGAATRLRLLHSAIRAEDARRGVGMGWDASFAHLLTHVSSQ